MQHVSRRHFLWTAASALAVVDPRLAAQPSALTAKQIVDRLRDKIGTPWRDTSADGFKAGSPDALVSGIATAVMPTMDVLRRAAAAGHNLIVTQEPAFYTAAEYGGISKQRSVDQIVVNYGTIPLDELYFELKPLSRNLGAVNHDDLIEGRPQTGSPNAGGAFQLFRIGDAVASRNTHAAIYDALRLVKDL